MRIRNFFILLCLLMPDLANAFTLLKNYHPASYVVVASYSSEHSATWQATSLSERFQGIFVVIPAETQSGFIYRVVSGPHKEAAAQKLKAELKDKGISDAWIWRVVETQNPPNGSLLAPEDDQANLPLTKPATTNNQSNVSAQKQPRTTYSQPGATQADSTFSWSLRGYLKSYAMGQQTLDIKNAPAGLMDTGKFHQSQNSMRLIFEGTSSGNLAFELHYEMIPVFYSSALQTNPFSTETLEATANNYRVSDIQQQLGNTNNKSRTLQNLDRANIQLRLEAGDLTIGRQAISFGSARAINPTDVFLPFNVQTLNQEYRIGVDAIRFQSPLGDLGELDMGIIIGEDARAENSAIFLQTLNNFSGLDLQATAIRFAEHNLLGLGIQTSLGEYGFWFEAARVWSHDQYTRASMGFDYAFTENVFAMLEFHYNGAGSRRPEVYLQNFDNFAYQKGGVFLQGQRYLIPSINWTASALLGFSLQAIRNLDDSSTFVNLSGDYSLSENLYSSFGIYVFTGDGIQFTSTPPNLIVGSEYGINPDMWYFSLRYYF